MTSGLKADKVVAKLKEFLLQSSDWFGYNGPYKNDFSLFESSAYEYLERKNVLFNDATKSLVDVGERDRYYTWIGITML